MFVLDSFEFKRYFIAYNENRIVYYIPHDNTVSNKFTGSLKSGKKMILHQVFLINLSTKGPDELQNC